MVLFIHREKVTEKPEDIIRQTSGLAGSDPSSLLDEASLIIGKQRNGPLTTVDLVFLKKVATFAQKASDHVGEMVDGDGDM